MTHSITKYSQYNTLLRIAAKWLPIFVGTRKLFVVIIIIIIVVLLRTYLFLCYILENLKKNIFRKLDKNIDLSN